MPSRESELPRMPIATTSSSSIHTGTWRSQKPIINRELCSQCYTCWKFCPDIAVEIVNDNPEINYDYCKGCGICANECPKKAIEMIRQELE